jgi:hypothetical protein
MHVQSLLRILIATIFLFTNAALITIEAKEDTQRKLTEVLNDNPDVSFTATGIASEPGPVHVASFPVVDVATWTNTTLDKPSMYNSWFTTPEGTLKSSSTDFIHRPWYGVKHHKFSLPLGSSNYGLGQRSIEIPWSSSGSGLTYLSGESFIFSDFMGSEMVFYLVSPSNPPVLIDRNGSAASPRIYMRRDIGEVMIYGSYGPRYCSGSYCYEQNFKLFDIEALAAGDVNPKAQGAFNAQRWGNSAASYNGNRAKFGDGSEPNLTGSKAKFGAEYKQINLTQRTIESFVPGSKSPYKTESYSNIPSLSSERCKDMNCDLYYLPGTAAGYDRYLFQTPGWGLEEEDIMYVRDSKGSYYTSLRIGTGNSVVRWDGVTGFPEVMGPTNHPDSDVQAVSADGKYVETSYTWHMYDSDGYITNTGTSTQWENLLDGSIYSTRPGDYIDFMPEAVGAYKNGLGIKAFPYSYTYYDDSDGGCFCNVTVNTSENRLVDITTGALVQEPTMLSPNVPAFYSVTSQATFFKNGTYLHGITINGGKYYANLYTYNPFTEQTAYSNEGITMGQLINQGSQQVLDGTVSWSVKLQETEYDNASAGLAFRIQNHQNMYRVESYGKYLQLVRISGGRKAVLGRVARNVSNHTWTGYQVKLSGTHIKVYENGGLMIDVYDESFAQGTIGPFSTADHTEFKGLTYTWRDTDTNFNTPGTSIVDTVVTYHSTYSDPEADPRLDPQTQWNYEHVEPYRFLDVGDGKSGVMPPTTVTNPKLTFDKVGLYKVDYRVPDDPHPDHRIVFGDTLFSGYAKYSDWYTQYVIVHRRPFAPFMLAQTGDGTVEWTDLSYDPDRCYAHGNCQALYAGNNGIYAKKFYYITPSGVKMDSKLIRPLETGSYTVAMASQDEYQAWSDWHETALDVAIAAAPNNPPTVVLTFPSGTQANPSQVSLLPTISWNQADPDPGTLFSTFNLTIKDEWGNCIECVTNQVMDTTSANWSWTMDQPLTEGQKYQVQVQASDGEAWSAWSDIGWMATNTPPAAYMSFPYGTQTVPTIVTSPRPTFTWSQTDPDAGARFDYFQIQVTNEANTVMVLDSGNVWEGTTSTMGSWQAPSDLPTGQKLRVRVAVWDQYGAPSEWSPQTWMVLDRPPVAAFTWAPQVVYEGDVLQLADASSDPDGDPLAWHWSIQTPEGGTLTSSAKNPATIAPATVGSYMVKLTVTDPHGMSDQITHTIKVLPLTIAAAVGHTPRWEVLRQESNLTKGSDPELPWRANQFLAGERFILHADTTPIDPESTVTALKVEVSWDRTAEHVVLVPSGSPNGWDGEMWEDTYLHLAPGTASFTFTATYSNGSVKSTVFPVEILENNIDQFWTLKRDK